MPKDPEYAGIWGRSRPDRSKSRKPTAADSCLTAPIQTDRHLAPARVWENLAHGLIHPAIQRGLDQTVGADGRAVGLGSAGSGLRAPLRWVRKTGFGDG